MKAAWYEQFGPAAEVFTVGELEAPQPAPGEVLVRLHASAVAGASARPPSSSRWMTSARHCCRRL